jgi:hypothetical protein
MPLPYVAVEYAIVLASYYYRDRRMDAEQTSLIM